MNHFEKFMSDLDKKEGKDSEGFTYEEMEKAWHAKKKKGLDVLIVILLLILITLSSYTIIYPGIKEVVWLVPNDESCSDIWLEKDFDGVIGGYELKLIEGK